MRVLKKKIAGLLLLLLLFSFSHTYGQRLSEARPYEAIRLMAGSSLFRGEFYGKPIEKYCVLPGTRLNKTGVKFHFKSTKQLNFSIRTIKEIQSGFR
jgi:hypothetical protein